MHELRAQVEVTGKDFMLRMMSCHKIPERCLVVAGRRMPVCARCFGSYLGHAAAVVLFLFGVRIHWALGLALVLPMGVDWGIQRWFGIMSTNARRLVTGLMAGFGLGMEYMWGISWVVNVIIVTIKGVLL